MKAITALVLAVTLTACGHESPLQVESRSAAVSGQTAESPSMISTNDGTLARPRRLRPTRETTGFQGHVWRASPCPDKEPCLPSPLVALIVVTNTEGKTVAKGYSSSKDGSYSIILATGKYWVTASHESIDGTLVPPKPVLVEIFAGARATVDFMFETEAGR